jgi:peptidyl-prolyl cis-trans isomerase B (cyclophilin B)
VAGKKERQRKLARQRYQRRTIRQAERDRRVRRWTISVLAAVAVAAIAVGSALFATRPGSPSAAATPSVSATPTPTPTPTPAPTPVAEPAHHCAYSASGAAARKVSLPPATPDYKATYRATITTNLGNIVIDLLNSKATCTVNSFISLAAQKFFNKTPCHRLTTAGSLFVLQCGDPTGTGSGGPGYQFNDENLTGATYTAGTVAMANSGANTDGSQFFLVYKNSTLQPNYTPFGTIVSGLNIIQKVAKGGTDSSNAAGDGHPKDKVEVESVTIKKT